MADVGNMNRVPLFLKAKKPEQLIALMHKNNAKRGKEFQYQIVHDGKDWFAWYYQNLIDDLKTASRNKGR